MRLNFWLDFCGSEPNWAKVSLSRAYDTAMKKIKGYRTLNFLIKQILTQIISAEIVEVRTFFKGEKTSSWTVSSPVY